MNRGVRLVPPAYPYTTTFPLTENPISESNGWVNGFQVGRAWSDVLTASGSAQASVINAGGAAAPDGPFDDSIAHRTGFPANHGAEAILSVAGGYSPGVSHECEILLTFKITNRKASGLEASYGITASTIVLVWWKGDPDDFVVIDTIEVGGFADNDVMRATLVGDNVFHHKNGVLVGTTTGITALALPQGNPGVGFWARNGATLASYKIKDWKAFAA